jgi:hypothetical protein
MADRNPMGGERIVSLDHLSAEQVSLLRGHLRDWLHGLRLDLRGSDSPPEKARREAEAYERLLVGLTLREIYVPDEGARHALREATDSYDEESNFAEVQASHDALHSLLACLDPCAEASQPSQ